MRAIVVDDKAVVLTKDFFFSSREHHTRYWRDWSSDVCSSDLLHVRVAAHGARARAGLARLTAEQQEVDYLLNVCDGVLVLREPHRPADYRALRRDEDLRGLAHLLARDAARLGQLAPTRLAERARELLEAVRALVYELPVEHVAGPQ